MATRKKPVQPQPFELRGRAAWTVGEQAGEHASVWGLGAEPRSEPSERDLGVGGDAAGGSMSGCTPETLRPSLRRAERDRGERAGRSSGARVRLKAPGREVRKLGPATGIPCVARAYLAVAGARRSAVPFRSPCRCITPTPLVPPIARKRRRGFAAMSPSAPRSAGFGQGSPASTGVGRSGGRSAERGSA